MMHIEFPYLHKICEFPPFFGKILKSPLFSFNLGFFGLIYAFYFPYFDHDAFMQHALHVLDARGAI